MLWWYFDDIKPWQQAQGANGFVTLATGTMDRRRSHRHSRVQRFLVVSHLPKVFTKPWDVVRMRKDKVRECGKIPGDEYESETSTPQTIHILNWSAWVFIIIFHNTRRSNLIISDLSHCPNLQHWISCAGSCGTSLMFNAAWWYFVVPFNLSNLGYLGSTLRLQVPGSLNYFRSQGRSWDLESNENAFK